MNKVNLNLSNRQTNFAENKTQSFRGNRSLSFGETKDEICLSTPDKKNEAKEKKSFMRGLKNNAAAVSIALSAAAAGLSGYNTVSMRNLQEAMAQQGLKQIEMTNEINNEINNEIKPYTLDNFEKIAKKANNSTAVIKCISLNENENPSKSLGSGLLIAPGLILTNNHVVDKGEFIAFIELPNLENPIIINKNNIIAKDKAYDLAVIKIPEEIKLPETALPLRLSSEEAVQGEVVAAMGSPLGLTHSFTIGTVSNTERNLSHAPKSEALQTDAAINQGNSGGPLLSLKGEVIGVNVTTLGKSNDNTGISPQGLSFSIKASSVRKFLEENKIHINPEPPNLFEMKLSP